MNWPRLKLSMATTLALAFGGMTALALAIVIIGSFITAGQNARTLTTDRVNLLLDHVTGGVADFLDPAEQALTVTARLLSEADGDPDRIDEAVRGILLSTPQLGGIGLFRLDGQVRFLGRPPKMLPRQMVIPIERSNFEVTDDVGVVWSDPFWSETSQSTLINAQLRLPDDEHGPRLLVTGVFLPIFVQWLDQLASQTTLDVFVMHGTDQVVGYSGFDSSSYAFGPEQVLPRLDEIGDPVLARIWDDDIVEDNDIGSPQLDGSARLVIWNDTPFGLIYRVIDDFAELPWLVGVKVNLEEHNEPFQRLLHSGMMAIAISVIAVFVTMRLGKRLSRPLEALASRAQALQSLTTSALPALPESRIKEIDQANQAFNAMAGALRWFRTYLPKRLVAQLMSQGSPDEVTSEEREVTIMFTDIVDFSVRTAMLTPGETAAFLNDHFDILEACVTAEDGLIDKFIGDSVMAFWGAPQDQPDHAARAIATALRMRESLEAGEVAIRIGIHTGKVLVGNIGASERINYTVVGEAVNLAQRIEQYGKQVTTGEKVTILASHTTIALIGAAAPTIGAPILRGQNMPTELFRL